MTENEMVGWHHHTQESHVWARSVPGGWEVCLYGEGAGNGKQEAL